MLTCSTKTLLNKLSSDRITAIIIELSSSLAYSELEIAVAYDCTLKMNKTEKKCADKVQRAFNSRMEDIRTLYKADNQETPELGHLYEYGLSIDIVEAGTFEGQREDYICYQLSWGGPSEEFRIYKNGEIEFWYMDWFDGAKVDVTGNDAEIIKAIVEPLELMKIN